MLNKAKLGSLKFSMRRSYFSVLRIK